MAKEILVIERGQAIFFKLYDQAPIVIGGEPQVLRQGSDELPVAAAVFVGDTVKSLIDEGRISWEGIPVERAEGETDEHLKARYKQKWAKWSAREGRRISRWASEIAAIRWINI